MLRSVVQHVSFATTLLLLFIFSPNIVSSHISGAKEYTINVTVPDRQWASTTADVWFKIVGARNETDWFVSRAFATSTPIEVSMKRWLQNIGTRPLQLIIYLEEDGYDGVYVKSASVDNERIVGIAGNGVWLRGESYCAWLTINFTNSYAWTDYAWAGSEEWPTNCLVLPDNTPNPTVRQTYAPSNQPTIFPTFPTAEPSNNPTYLPTLVPTSGSPTKSPSNYPSTEPTAHPSGVPSIPPTGMPSITPSAIPSNYPSGEPSAAPTDVPSSIPSDIPSTDPTSMPTNTPTDPTIVPSSVPSNYPTKIPSIQPTFTRAPTDMPTAPSIEPSVSPTNQPTTIPTSIPSNQPSVPPTMRPSNNPTSIPSLIPTLIPTQVPTTGKPTQQPTDPESIDDSSDDNNNNGETKTNKSNSSNGTDFESLIPIIAGAGALLICILISLFLLRKRVERKRKRDFNSSVGYGNYNGGTISTLGSGNVTNYGRTLTTTNGMERVVSAENSVLSGNSNAGNLRAPSMGQDIELGQNDIDIDGDVDGPTISGYLETMGSFRTASPSPKGYKGLTHTNAFEYRENVKTVSKRNLFMDENLNEGNNKPPEPPRQVDGLAAYENVLKQQWTSERNLALPGPEGDDETVL